MTNQQKAIALWEVFLSSVLVRSHCLIPEGHPHDVKGYVNYYNNELGELDYKIEQGFSEKITPLDHALLKDEFRLRLKEIG
jgi:hypothetical protein